MNKYFVSKKILLSTVSALMLGTIAHARWDFWNTASSEAPISESSISSRAPLREVQEYLDNGNWAGIFGMKFLSEEEISLITESVFNEISSVRQQLSILKLSSEQDAVQLIVDRLLKWDSHTDGFLSSEWLSLIHSFGTPSQKAEGEILVVRYSSDNDQINDALSYLSSEGTKEQKDQMIQSMKENTNISWLARNWKQLQIMLRVL
jgi:hypothetical protein